MRRIARTASKTAVLVMLVALATSSSGCLLFVAGAAAGAGIGTYAYINGELKTSESVKLDKAYDATLVAMKDLSYPVTEKQKDVLEGKIVARTAGDKKIQVNLKKTTDTVTEIRIRVGTFGDETLSRHILEKIKAHI
jgi:hypothetical protein